MLLWSLNRVEATLGATEPENQREREKKKSQQGNTRGGGKNDEPNRGVDLKGDPSAPLAVV